MTVEEKRRVGITGGAGVSVLRADREVAYGWYFLGDKRRQNYDDWWRCEVSFTPDADELFGITHTKQQILPTPTLNELLSRDLGTQARELSGRVRARFAGLKRDAGPAVSRVVKKDPLLPPLTRFRNAYRGNTGLKYRITTSASGSADFFQASIRGRVVTLTLNTRHPFYEKIYKPLIEIPDKGPRQMLEIVLLAAARASLNRTDRTSGASVIDRGEWSDALAAFV